MNSEPAQVDNMKNQKDDLQVKANEAKKKRDTLHSQSKKFAQERDDFNAKIRQIRNQINEHKTRRDEYNERVKHAKEQRNELLKDHMNMRKTIQELERSRSTTSGINLNRLKLSLRKMETEQMTQPMSPQKEKKLIESIKELHQKVKDEEEKLNQDPKLKDAIENEKLLKQKAEKQHDIVEKIAKKAQEEHQVMIELLNQLDSLSKRTLEIQEKIVHIKIDADSVHKEFIEHVNKIHDLEKQISTTEKTKDRKRKIADVSETQKQANDIFERFKRGEKLSTEDLMVLQKAGLL
jgi:uncharacterized coiled-coil DUF342 family protein